MKEKMNTNSIDAYDLPERVRTYDTDMEIMHPLRWKMIEIALEVLPFHATEYVNVLDLGVGTGCFSQQLFTKCPNSKLVAVDGSALMIELAKLRLGAQAQLVEWIQSDFRSIPSQVLKPNRYDAVISSYALHHLNAQEKLAVLTAVVMAIKPNGWFINAEVVKAEYPDIERRIQDIRVKAVTERAPEKDERFLTIDSTRSFLDTLEATEKDQPQTLNTDMNILQKAGIRNAEVFWREYREVVFGGTKIDIT